MKCLMLQVGDYADAYNRFAAGGKENYRGQKHSVDFVANLVRPDLSFTVLAVCGREHRETVAEGLTSVGITMEQSYDRAFVRKIMQEEAPDLFICRVPNHHFIGEAKRLNYRTLGFFADFFANGSLRLIYQNALTALAVRAPNFTCLANHSLNASISIHKTLRYPKDKIVPWEETPIAQIGAPKARVADKENLKLFFAGAVTEEKGVGDCLKALKILKETYPGARFNFAGRKDDTDWDGQADALGLSDSVTFLGLIANEEVRHQMKVSDLVVVPTQHSYAEGLPNTIIEALTSATPVVLSDHPAFNSRFSGQDDVAVFEAANPNAFAAKISELVENPVLYETLSRNSEQTQRALYVGLEWVHLVKNFLEDPENTTGWVQKHNLPALQAEQAT